MISIDSIVKLKGKDHVSIPILNVTCRTCSFRWSHRGDHGFIRCRNCGDASTIEEALDLFVKTILMFGRTP